MVGNDVNAMLGTFKVMAPDFEAFEDGQEFLIMCIVILLSVREGTGMETYGMDLAIRGKGRNCWRSYISPIALLFSLAL